MRAFPQLPVGQFDGRGPLYVHLLDFHIPIPINIEQMDALGFLLHLLIYSIIYSLPLIS